MYRILEAQNTQQLLVHESADHPPPHQPPVNLHPASHPTPLATVEVPATPPIDERPPLAVLRFGVQLCRSSPARKSTASSTIEYNSRVALAYPSV